MRLYSLICLFFIFFSGCSSIQELDIWPVVFYEHDEEKKETQLDLMTSIYSYRDTPKETTHAFRPLFVGEFPKDQELTRLLFLWPLGYMSREPNDTKIWVLPFYYYRDIKRPEMGERDFDWFFLPFLTLGGTDTKEGSYLHVFVWGNIKGLFMYDEISMTPFPFYVKARDGEYETRGYLWPLFRFGDGGGKKFRFYCLFYSYYEKEGKFRRQSYLWPLIHYNEEDLHKKHPRTEFFFLPFYGQTVSDVALSRTVLWPFFSYAYDTHLGYTEYNCPWPFFKYRTGADLDEFRIWPLYWTSEKKITPVGKEKDLILLWPFFWYLQGDYLTYQNESLYILPFYWSHWRKGKEKDAQPTERIKVWPLCLYEKQEDGTVRYRGLSPLWFEDYIPYGIEKAWLPLVTVFDYSSGPKGAKNFTMLGPLYQYKESADSLYHRFLIASYKKVMNEKEDKRRFSVLGGLFEYQWDKGENRLRFFYLPPLIHWGEQKGANSNANTGTNPNANTNTNAGPTPNPNTNTNEKDGRTKE